MARWPNIVLDYKNCTLKLLNFTIISVTGGYYPSPGIDFEVLGGKMEGLGLTPVGVGSEG
jgi:hypothetical protein